MITIDESEFPVIKILYSGRVTVDDWTRLAAVLEQRFEDGNPFVTAVSNDGFKFPEMGLIKAMGAWVSRHDEDLRCHTLRAGLHISSAAARGALGFYNKIATTPVPMSVFATWDEALAWVREAFEEPTG